MLRILCSWFSLFSSATDPLRCLCYRGCRCRQPRSFSSPPLRSRAVRGHRFPRLGVKSYPYAIVVNHSVSLSHGQRIFRYILSSHYAVAFGEYLKVLPISIYHGHDLEGSIGTSIYLYFIGLQAIDMDRMYVLKLCFCF